VPTKGGCIAGEKGYRRSSKNRSYAYFISFQVKRVTPRYATTIFLCLLVHIHYHGHLLGDANRVGKLLARDQPSKPLHCLWLSFQNSSASNAVAQMQFLDLSVWKHHVSYRFFILLVGCNILK